MVIREFSNTEAKTLIKQHCTTIFQFITNNGDKPFVTPEEKQGLLATATRLFQLIDEQLLTPPHENNCGSETTWP